MNKIPNGNWENDKIIYHKALLNGHNILKILEEVYKCGHTNGCKEGIEFMMDTLDGIDHD